MKNLLKLDRKITKHYLRNMIKGTKKPLGDVDFTYYCLDTKKIKNKLIKIKKATSYER